RRAGAGSRAAQGRRLMAGPVTGDPGRSPGETTVRSGEMVVKSGRERFMDAQRVNLDGFAAPDASLGLVAMDASADPVPSLVVAGGRVTEMDGVAEADFDSIDAFIARH